MIISITGTGTSQGVPVIGCKCEVCSSPDPRDQRLRTAAVLEHRGVTIAFDCGPDFRQQMLRAQIASLNAILITHEHNDHVIGLDDVRPFNFMNRADMPVYTTERVGEELRKRFSYIFEHDPYPGAPMIRLHTIARNDPFLVEGITVLPVEVMHGSLPVMGYRIGDFAYITDVRTIDPEEMEKLKDLKVLVISALHHQEHHSHVNLEQALHIIGILKPERSYLTHMSHRMGLHAEVQATLPAGVFLAYDGLKIEG